MNNANIVQEEIKMSFGGNKETFDIMCSKLPTKQMGLKKIVILDDDFTEHFEEWVESKPVKIS